MINNTESKKLYKVQSGVTEYPIGFPFQCNSDGVPQLAITIGTTYLQLNYNCKLSEDNGTLILIPTEEEAETLTGPEDYSWMDKWVDAPLVITRDIPFVQESDYQVGRISPEQIEKDFDASVMRDQILLDKIGEHTTDVSAELESLHTDISDINAELATKATKTELDNYKLTANAAIDANATAIQKTREDYISADSEIHKILNDHTKRLDTLRTDHDDLGDDVSDIQAKIPESASGSNPMVTKQQLATKQDKLTAGDNIIISNNVISATGTGGAGFDAIVVQELPESGLKGVIYLVPSDGETPDVYDEYLWIESTGTFELIGKTKVDLSGYATKEDLENIDALPDQSGNSGKFLMTNGAEASWSDKPLVNKPNDKQYSVVITPDYNNNYGSYNVAIGAGIVDSRSFGVHIGYQSMDTTTKGYSVGVGYYTQTNAYAIAIGYKAEAKARYSIQLGQGTNNDTNTFKVANENGNFEMMSADGTIPVERMSATAGTTGQVLTKTDAGMEWQEPSGGTTITLKEYDE